MPAALAAQAAVVHADRQEGSPSLPTLGAQVAPAALVPPREGAHQRRAYTVAPRAVR
jgi:hypothetical protein